MTHQQLRRLSRQLLLLTIWGIAAFALPLQAQVRTWTATNGKTVRAKFVRVYNGKVMLRKGTRVIPVDMNDLSEPDREYVQRMLGGETPAEVAAEEVREQKKEESTSRKKRSEYEVRVWTDRKGNTLKASFDHLEGDRVFLKRAKKLKGYALRSFSDRDQEYLQDLLDSKGTGTDLNEVLAANTPNPTPSHNSGYPPTPIIDIPKPPTVDSSNHMADSYAGNNRSPRSIYGSRATRQNDSGYDNSSYSSNRNPDPLPSISEAFPATEYPRPQIRVPVQPTYQPNSALPPHKTMLLGIALCLGVVNLACWIGQVITFISNDEIIWGVIGLLCGPGALIAFVVGWMNVENYNSHKLMGTWTFAIVGQIVLAVLANAT